MLGLQVRKPIVIVLLFNTILFPKAGKNFHLLTDQRIYPPETTGDEHHLGEKFDCFHAEKCLVGVLSRGEGPMIGEQPGIVILEKGGEPVWNIAGRGVPSGRYRDGSKTDDYFGNDAFNEGNSGNCMRSCIGGMGMEYAANIWPVPINPQMHFNFARRLVTVLAYRAAISVYQAGYFPWSAYSSRPRSD